MLPTRLRALRHRLPRPLEIADRCLDRLVIPFGDYGFINAGPPERRAVALSFDDGPSRDTTSQVLDLLDVYGAKATFFVLGEQVEENIDLLGRMVASGHELGNHTYSHHHTLYMTKAQLRDEIRRTNEALAKVCSSDVRLVRPPYGKDRRRTAALARELGMRVALWSVDSGDASEYSTAEIVETVLRAARPGSIVLLHDGGKPRTTTIDACAQILPALREERFELVTISELVEGSEPSTLGWLAPQDRDLAR
jgi:peptidoglycan/xylan/chitin deacetylase (PgdA/CDA1 family)